MLSENYQNDLSRSRMGKALNAVVDTRPDSLTQGQTVCRVNADVDLSNDDPACVPWNIFNIGGVTPNQLAYLQIPGVMQGSTTEQVLSGSISGDLGQYGIKLPTANDGIAFAVRRGVSLGALRAAPGCLVSDERPVRSGRADARHDRRIRRQGSLRRVARAAPAGQADGADAVVRNGLPLLGLQPRLRHEQLQARSRLGSSRQRPAARQLSARSALAERAGAVPAAACPAERHHRSVRGRSDQCKHGGRSDGHLRTVRALRCHGRAVRQHPREPGRAVQRQRDRQSGPRSRGIRYVLVRHRAHAVVPAELQPVARLLRHQGREGDRTGRSGLHPGAVPRRDRRSSAAPCTACR